MVSYQFGKKVAVVTGGGAGIGQEITLALVSCGVDVAAWDLRPAPACAAGVGVHSKAGGETAVGAATEAMPGGVEQGTALPAGRILACSVDVTDRAAVAAALAQTEAQLGPVDILVNSAGYAGPTLPLAEYAPEEWTRILDINLTGVFNVCQALVPGMTARGWGRIVNLASLAGKEGTPNASAYSASKAGVLALTKSLGKELARSGVLVNAIAPAAVRTAMLAQMSPEHVSTMIGKSPMGRLGEPEEVAAMVLWLCSDACSFNTGAVFDLSGGRATY